MAKKTDLQRGAILRWAGLLALPLLCVIACAGTNPAKAQSAQVEFIVQSLLPKEAPPTSRSWGAKKKTRSFDIKSRGIDIKGPLPKDLDLPSVDMTVNFEYDSARLTNDGILILNALGQALNDNRLRQMDFQIAGHTDGRGTFEYNQDLSERRANTVVWHLSSFYNIASGRLSAIGYGKTQLLNPTYPEDPINRRVQIINLAPLF